MMNLKSSLIVALFFDKSWISFPFKDVYKHTTRKKRNALCHQLRRNPPPLSTPLFFNGSKSPLAGEIFK